MTTTIDPHTLDAEELDQLMLGRGELDRGAQYDGRVLARCQAGGRAEILIAGGSVQTRTEFRRVSIGLFGDARADGDGRRRLFGVLRVDPRDLRRLIVCLESAAASMGE